MSDSFESMPPLVRAFWHALSCSPTDRAWLKQHGHDLIDALPAPAPSGASAIPDVLRLLSEGLMSPDSWGEAIWDHDLVAKVVVAAGLDQAAQDRLAMVESWEALQAYVGSSQDVAQAQERALEATERIQEVIRLAVEFELAAMD